ncbi:Transcription antitermination protein NusB [bioreactor metagenome]|uniref:Transcription antitermination protein NusB n=1 Tax=bioreactor metagenome TaxID=1076179 RepID=A0A645AL22_9ZZZZ
MSRSKARESAFKVIFEASFKKDETVGQILDLYYDNNDTSQLGDETEYFEKLVNGVIDQKENYSKLIDKLSIGWKAQRISKVATSILQIAMYEIDHFEDVPTKVSINEAVELAKTYDTQNAASFINGILATYTSDREKDE